jgi:hypothetical protein
MDTIVKYLKNPLEIGVYSYSAIIDFSHLQKHFADFLDDLKAQEEKADRTSVRITLLQHRISQFEEALKKHTVEKKIDYFQSLTNVFYALTISTIGLNSQRRLSS